MQVKRCLCRPSGLESCLQGDINHSSDFLYTRLILKDTTMNRFQCFHILKDTTRKKQNDMKWLNGFSLGTEIHANATPPSRFYNGETETESENRFTPSGGFQRLFRDESSPHPYLKQFKGKSFSETKDHPIL